MKHNTKCFAALRNNAEGDSNNNNESSPSSHMVNVHQVSKCIKVETYKKYPFISGNFITLYSVILDIISAILHYQILCDMLVIICYLVIQDTLYPVTELCTTYFI